MSDKTKTTETSATALTYVGPSYAEVGVVPLPEGWHAFDHEEPDADLARRKLAFRLYQPGDKKGEPTGGPAYTGKAPPAEQAKE